MTGVYTLPAGNPVVTGTVIDPDWANNTLSDVAVALSQSLSVDGSVTPAKFSDDPAGFQQKMGLDVILMGFEARIAFLEDVVESKIGDIEPFGQSTAPTGYLKCDGSEVSRATYSDLFAVIGTTFGPGNGTTTFNVPDFRGVTPRGDSPDQARGVEQLGQVGTHTHTASTAAGNSHVHSGTTASDGIHGHTVTAGPAGAHTHVGSGTSGSNSNDHTHNFSGTTSSAGVHTHTLNFAVSEVSNVTGGAPVSSKSSASSGAHSHTVGGVTGLDSANHNHVFNVTSSTDGNHHHDITLANSVSHTHAFTTSTDGAHNHAITINSTGGEAAVANVAVPYYIRFKGV